MDSIETVSTVKFFEVGGCVRDELLGLSSKDVDFVVVADSFDSMRDELVGRGFKIFQERPEFLTIRAGVPAGDPLRERTKDADFVLARRDGVSSDGRRPDFVEAGSLHDDLARRDFTVNAIARDPISGVLIDPFGGAEDLRAGVLRFVGDPVERISEDGLRVLRGLRFQVTKGLVPTVETGEALVSDFAVRMLGCVPLDRIREELERMFSCDSLLSFSLLEDAGPEFRSALFRDGLRLSATAKQ